MDGVRRLVERFDAVRESLAFVAVRRAAERAVRRTGLTRGGWVAIGAAGVAWLVAFLVAGTALYIFSYATVLVPIASFFLAPRRLRLRGERAGLFPRALAGDRLEVHITLTAEGRVGPFILDEQIPETLGVPVRVPIARIAPGNELSVSYSLTCARRGVYQVGPLVAVAGDPIGLAQRETVLCDSYELLVHPRVERVSDRPLTRQYEDPPMRPPVSRPWPSGMELYGMREFRPGDDVRRVVWRATARTGTLMVWEAEQGITDRILIVLDTDRRHHSRDGGVSESFEMAVRVAASIGVGHLSDGYEVRCETNGGPLTRALRGVESTLLLLDGMARLELSRSPLTDVLRRLAADPRRDTHYLLVTPRMTDADAAQLKLLLDKGVSVAVVALLWDEEDSGTMGRAASLGCQVVGVAPGDDLGEALSRRGVGVGVAR
jgi:uncharacterized protein (DUF58 family)